MPHIKYLQAYFCTAARDRTEKCSLRAKTISVAPSTTPINKSNQSHDERRRERTRNEVRKLFEAARKKEKDDAKKRKKYLKTIGQNRYIPNNNFNINGLLNEVYINMVGTKCSLTKLLNIHNIVFFCCCFVAIFDY